MRRILAAAALGGALFAAAACGGNDNGNDGGDGGDPTGTGGTTEPTQGTGTGTLSNEEVCAEGEAVVTEFGTQFQEAGGELAAATATGDEAAMEEAAGTMTDISAETAGQLRDIAGTAEDPELQAAIEDFATELEGFGEAIAADPSALETLDTTGLDEATARMDELCPTE